MPGMISNVSGSKHEISRPQRQKKDIHGDKVKTEAWNKYVDDLKKEGWNVSELRKMKPDMMLDKKISHIQRFYKDNKIKYGVKHEKGRTSTKNILEKMARPARTSAQVLSDHEADCDELTLLTCALLQQSGEDANNITVVFGRADIKIVNGKAEGTPHTMVRVGTGRSAVTIETTLLSADKDNNISDAIDDKLHRKYFNFQEDSSYPYPEVQAYLQGIGYSMM